MIVAIVGNAAEHGGAVVVAARGKIKLATEIALASSAQVAVFLIPAVALLVVADRARSRSRFRPIELVGSAARSVVAALLLADGRSSRCEGAALIAATSASPPASGSPATAERGRLAALRPLPGEVRYR